MPDTTLPLFCLFRRLDDDRLLGEFLLFPETSYFHEHPDKLIKALKFSVQEHLSTQPAAALHAATPASDPSVLTVRLELPLPQDRLAAWSTPVPLTFYAACWAHGPHHLLAYVPGLGLEVRANAEPQLMVRLEREIRAALDRKASSTHLDKLALLQRTVGLEIDPILHGISLPTAKQRAIRQQNDEQGTKPSVLHEVGTELLPPKMARAYELGPMVTRLAEALSAKPRTSILLVGPPGVGKTATIYELVRTQLPRGLLSRSFFSTSGARLVAGQSGLGMWQERCRGLILEAQEKNAVLHMGALIELMEVGQSTQQSQSIASFLRPFMARGDLQLILECTPEQLPLIERQDPQLLGTLQQIVFQEPSPAQAQSILLSVALEAAGQGRPALEIEGIQTLERLHRRYASWSAWPGRPLRFLRNLLEDNSHKTTLSQQDITAAFARETGLPSVLLEDETPLDLAATRTWFRARVIGQPEGVDQVVDLLAMIKANLTRPRKPLASLLFIGPTGVGKTQMARSLAEFLFQSADRVTRFDMSEYASPGSVERLIGGRFGAEGLLTARVREHPFSVLLFDEFEKAHPLFFDLLLQVLGEGRLTDAGGRVADFSNAVIIMTSNLGAEDFSHSTLGFQQSGARDLALDHVLKHFEGAVKRFLRPELYNRIDRILPFLPLEPQTVRQIARRELELLQKRDGILLREVEVTVEEGVDAHLATRGYDVRYGARPLKRAVERELLAPLAAGLNAFRDKQPLDALISVTGDTLRVDVKGRQDKQRQRDDHQQRAMMTLVKDCMAFRRELDRVDRGAHMLEYRNQLETLRRQQKRLAHRARKALPPRLESPPASVSSPLELLLSTFDQLRLRAYALEEQVLLHLYADTADNATAPDLPSRTLELAQQRKAWNGWIEQMSRRRYPFPDRIVLGIFCPDKDVLMTLVTAWAEVIEGRKDSVQFVALQPDHVGTEGLEIPRKAYRNFSQVPLHFDKSIIGFLLEITGPMARARYEGETGLHIYLLHPQLQYLVEVISSDEILTRLVIPPDLARKRPLEGRKYRRRYVVQKTTIEDALLSANAVWIERRLSSGLAGLIERAYQHSLRSWVGLEKE